MVRAAGFAVSCAVAEARPTLGAAERAVSLGAVPPSSDGDAGDAAAKLVGEAGA
jgi:hypothetical protein